MITATGNSIISKNLKTGANVNISARNITIEDNVIIKDNVTIHCLDSLHIGKFSILGNNVNIQCNSFFCDEWLYMCDRAEVGRGGCFNPESNVKIGKHVGIFEGVVLNPNSELTIGDDCGIGSECMFWTHGAWLNPLNGFPKDFGPITVGHNVWIPARTIVLPNVTIGDNVVIGTNSLINKSIPSGSMAAGIPGKVRQENAYPKKLSNEQKSAILNDIKTTWLNLLKFKNVDITRISLKIDEKINIVLDTEYGSNYFDLDNKTIQGESNNISEDLRDFLRRNGIKIYTDKHFHSIKL
jgi:acetyltransferase-like isoleucine patch superfamily enzyme